ncbi:MAG: hypothetical protein ACR65T_09630 [Methylocystis sp.]|uniref:hypothetical protein n=1 Tax=Methylocystis sp. TaxID=1911079 RepID=UPI003DA6CA11
MSNGTGISQSVSDDFADQFDAGVAAAEGGEIPEALVSADEMARAIFVAGKISGAALWLTDNMGEENAVHALQTAFQLIQARAAHRREKGN